MRQAGSLWGIGGQESSEKYCTSIAHPGSNAQLGYGKGLGEIALPDKWQSLSSAVGAPKWQSNPSWCLGANCPSCVSPLVKKQGQLNIAWGTDPAQHHRKGLGDGSKGPAAPVTGTCVSALVTCDGTDSHFSKMGGLRVPESPAYLSLLHRWGWHRPNSPADGSHQ